MDKREAIMREQGREGEREIFSPAPSLHFSPAVYFIGLIVVLIVAAAFRFYGLAWDGGYLFHPDERKIILVASDLALPSNPLQLFSTDSSLNPKFFAYGSFPIYLLRALSMFAPHTNFFVPWRDNSLVDLALLGRTLSALFDLGTIGFTFLLARRLYDARVGLLASACIAVTVLHIQLAHFYAVDTLLTMLVVATMYCAARFAQTGARRVMIAMSVLYGLALATKTSAVVLIVPMVVAVVHVKGKKEIREKREIREVRERKVQSARRVIRVWMARIWATRATLARTVAIALAVFFVTQPYALLDPIRFFGQVGTEWFVARGWLDYPYTRQYADTPPFLYHITQSTIWGMGLPLGIFAWLGSALFVWQWIRTRAWGDGFILAWALFYFLAMGAQYAKYLRYLLPLTPFLFLMASVAFSRITRHASRNKQYLARFAFSLVIGATFVYSLAFVSIYAREHPWIAISKWIYANIPAESSVIVEHWDELLPVSLRLGEPRSPTEYRITLFPFFDDDTPAKRDALVDALASSDYIILASQRLYGTIPRLAARYPMSSRYYRALFDGQLGFEPVMHALNAPTLDGVVLWADPFARVALKPPFTFDSFVFNWGFADESFTVYDQPVPIVFKKTRALSMDQLRVVLTNP
ncbi:MAG: glycosyltransferase family 39 protein [Chloroflexi bacterium]|nr:glycosyltransferase family 39 protein [Chloroflexota bacterium]